MNNSLRQLIKHLKISYEVYQRLRSTDPKPARFYGLAKVHNKDILRRPVLSITGSSSKKLNRSLAPCFQKLPGANNENNMHDARRALESLSLSLEYNEQIVSLDVKNLYTKVPVGEATKIALKELHFSNLAPEIPRSAMKNF